MRGIGFCAALYIHLGHPWERVSEIQSIKDPLGAFHSSSDSPVMSPERPAVTPAVKAQWKESFPDNTFAANLRRCSVSISNLLLLCEAPVFL